MSKPYNRVSKFVIEPSYNTAELSLLHGTSASELVFNLEWSTCDFNIKILDKITML